jgi:hypothetical protein
MQESLNTDRNYVHKLKFQVRDTLLAARYGFNARNIWVFWKGIILAWAVWAFFVYAGFLAAGDSMAEKFESARLCPIPDTLFMSSTPAVILLVIGSLLALFIYLASSLKVSRLTFEQLRGDQFYSERDARRFCIANWKPLVATPLAVASGIALGVFALFLAGLLGKIPSAGPVIAGFLAFPAWMLGLFLVLAIVVLCLSLFLVPVIIASTRGDTFECLFELFSIVTSQPIRLFRGFVTGTLIRLTALAVFCLFSWGSLTLVSGVFSFASGTNGPGNTMESGFSAMAPEAVPYYSSIFNPVGSTEHTDRSWAGASGLIASIAGTAILLILVAYWFSSCTALWTIIYLGARFHRDGEDLLKRAEEEEYREFRKVYGSTDHGGDRALE